MCISESSAASFDDLSDSRPVVIIVGGEPSHPHCQRLRRAFPGHRIEHLPTRSSDASSRRFAGAFRDPHLELVVVVIGLCRTQHSKDAIRLSRLFGTTWVTCRRLPHPRRLQAMLANRLHGGRS